MIAAPILVFFAAAMQPPVADPQREAVEVESTLGSISLGLILSRLGTCDDIIRDAEVDRLWERYRRIRSEAESLFGREMMSTIHIVEGDSCSQYRFYERNVRVSRRNLDALRKRLRAVAKGQSAREGGIVSERLQG